MAVNPVEHLWTYEDYLTLPDDGKRYYLDEGRLIEMAPSPTLEHQDYVGELYLALRLYGRTRQSFGKLWVAPVDILWTGRRVPGTTSQPDLVFVREDRISAICRRAIEGVPDLVVEVLSPGLANYLKDTQRNVRLYRERGVPEYWLCDPNGPLNGKITVHRLQGWPGEPYWDTGKLVEIGSHILPGSEAFIPEDMR